MRRSVRTFSLEPLIQSNLRPLPLRSDDFPAPPPDGGEVDILRGNTHDGLKLVLGVEKVVRIEVEPSVENDKRVIEHENCWAVASGDSRCCGCKLDENTLKLATTETVT